jgi:protein gp37
MSDLFGAWVPIQQIESVLFECSTSPQHTCLVLTKNAPRLLKFADQFPANLHIGVSMPPDFILGKSLSSHLKEAMLRRSLQVLDALPSNLITWMSFEPLSWDVSPILNQYPTALRWAVIGAASNGRTYYQPNPEHVNRLLDVLDANNIPVFFKGNLKWDARREEYPE